MDLKFWTMALKEAKPELEAATHGSAVNTAARRLQLATAEPKQLEPAAGYQARRPAISLDDEARSILHVF